MIAQLSSVLIYWGALIWSPLAANAVGNVTCKTSSLDWYTSVVGETPCQTYQSLRQICNAGYAVGSLSPNTPPDNCDDQLSGCCCNSVAFALSMLCLNCQQGVGSGVNGDNGIDAGNGAYQGYLGTCSPNVNKSLPADIQKAVCNEKLKIDDDLYGLFWNTGAWYYMYTRETIQKDMLANGNNTFTHCASTTVNATTSSRIASFTGKPSATTAPSSNKSPSISGGAIGGIVVGVVAGVALAGFIFWFCLRRHRTSADAVYSSNSPNMAEGPYQIEPFHPQPSNAMPSTAPTSNAPTSTGPASSRHTNNASVDPQESGYGDSYGNSMTALPVTSRPPMTTVTSEKSSLMMQWNGEDSGMSHSSPSFTRTLPQPPAPNSEPLPERHRDAGQLGRSPSGRLPPAYGEQLD